MSPPPFFWKYSRFFQSKSKFCLSVLLPGEEDQVRELVRPELSLFSGSGNQVSQIESDAAVCGSTCSTLITLCSYVAP